jgi:hypothetical protein
MKTLFDKETHSELQSRIDSLAPASERVWGKMSPAQAMEHTARCIQMATGEVPMDQHFLGKLIGWMFRRKFLSEQPFPRNSPTGPTLIIENEPDFEATRARLKDLISGMHCNGPAACDGNVHGFFGKLTGDEWGICQYKHVDHHLRQFGK